MIINENADAATSALESHHGVETAKELRPAFYAPARELCNYFAIGQSILTPLGTKSRGEPTLQLSGDFVTDYVTYADVLEAPAQAHEAVAISLLAAVLNPNVHIKHGALCVTLDLWTLLLSPSGMGRNTLVDLARPVLDEAKIVGLLRNNVWGSGPALYQDLSQHPTGLFLWPELSAVLQQFKQAGFIGTKEWFTDRYDNLNTPESTVYRQRGGFDDTPPIVFQQAPRLNLLATSSQAWFVNSLDQSDSLGGFVPRWMIVALDAHDRLIPKPRETDQRLIAPLAELLRCASELKGEANLSAVEDIYAEWYRSAHARFSAQPNQALASAFFNRLRVHVLKLAVVFEVSQSVSLSVSGEAMDRAIDFANGLETTIFSLLPTGMSREGAEVDRIAERVRLAGVEGLLLSELTRAFQHMRPTEREQRIKTLLHGGVIHGFQRKTAGRPGKIVVHSDFVDEHQTQFPEDCLL